MRVFAVVLVISLFFQGSLAVSRPLPNNSAVSDSARGFPSCKYLHLLQQLVLGCSASAPATSLGIVRPLAPWTPASRNTTLQFI